MSESAGVAITTVLSALVIVDIVGNSLVCAIIKRNRDMRNPMNYLLVNLAVADILYATFVAPKVLFKLTFAHPDGVIGNILCKLMTGGNVAWIGGASSIALLLAIAVERYYAVVYPQGNKGRLTKRKLKVIIPGCWIFSLIFNTPLFLIVKFDKKTKWCVGAWPEQWMASAVNVAWLVLTVLPLALMVGLYSRIVYTLWFKRNDDNQHTHQQKGVIKVRKRVTLMVVAVTAIFGICWGTSSVVYVFYYVASYNVGPVVIAISDTMVLFNSAVNPFVYALLNQHFRERMKGIICCTASSVPIVHPTPDAPDIELANNTQPTHIAGLSSTE